MDWKAEYSALSSTRSQKKKMSVFSDLKTLIFTRSWFLQVIINFMRIIMF